MMNAVPLRACSESQQKGERQQVAAPSTVNNLSQWNIRVVNGSHRFLVFLSANVRECAPYMALR
ncbi:MAG: hypothetical protein LBT00_05015, partial [Spirochaetaceae bacterium]|nr:hypothetical protein [Spirochaetaceae bacterium]